MPRCVSVSLPPQIIKSSPRILPQTPAGGRARTKILPVDGITPSPNPHERIRISFPPTRRSAALKTATVSSRVDSGDALRSPYPLNDLVQLGTIG
jgi:hypothetical protein